MPQSPTTAQRLEQLAGELHDAAFDAHEARSPRQVESYIEKVESICSAARAAVRGNLRGPNPL
jgi:transposase